MGTLQEQISLSVVIPTLNAAETLSATLAVLRCLPLVDEVVVVDGGSIDATIALARAAGVQVVAAQQGRGTQLAAGAASASGNWLLFLHADCRLETNWATAVAAFLADPEATSRAGYFDFALDDPARAARRLERPVKWVVDRSEAFQSDAQGRDHVTHAALPRLFATPVKNRAR